MLQMDFFCSQYMVLDFEKGFYFYIYVAMFYC